MTFHEYPYTDFHEMNLDWVIAKVKELTLAWAQTSADWEELRTFVNDYFANLNVQDEINNKLDELAADGTLAALMAPYVASGLPSVVADQIAAVVANQIGAVVAAQLPAKVAEQLPAAVAGEAANWLSTHVDPETGYVIDNSLTIAGAAADAKATGDAFGELKNAINKLPFVSQFIIANVTSDKYLDNDGTEINYVGWTITDYMPIKNIGMYYLKTAVTTNSPKTCLYNKDREFISSLKTGEAGYNKLVTSDDVAYIRFSVQSADISDFNYFNLNLIGNTNDSLLPTNIYGNSLIKSYIDDIIDNEFYTDHGSIATGANWCRTPLYEVNTGDEITVIGAQLTYAVLFDSNKDFVSYKNSSEKTETFTIESGIKYVGFNLIKADKDNYRFTVNGIPFGSIYKLSWLNALKSIWSDKTYISHGDSITWQDGKAYQQGAHIGEIAKGYQTIFSKSVNLKSYNNQGVSGWPMAIVNGNGVVNTIMAIADYGIYNLCTIACGTNDFKLNVPLGTLGQIGDTTFDDSTFYGAYRKAIEYILTSSPTIRLVLMTPLQRNNAGYDVNYINSAGCKLIDYVNAIKSIGEMYGLPVCDMYANSGFTEKTLATYTMDGLHPNDIGYTRMGDYLTGFLNVIGN